MLSRNRVNKKAKIDFLADYVEADKLAELDMKMDLLFEKILQKKLSRLLEDYRRTSVEEAISDILFTRTGKINIALIPILQDYIKDNRLPKKDYLISRLDILMKNVPLKKEIEKPWVISETAHWINQGVLDNIEISLKRNIITLLLSHPRQHLRQNCFAFSIAWAFFCIAPERIVADLREIAEMGGLHKKRGKTEHFFPYLRSHEKTPLWSPKENHPLFEVWSSVLASMAEGTGEGIITMAIVKAILYQAVRFLHSENERKQIPQIKKALLNRVYVGYDPYAFNHNGGFTLYDQKNTLTPVDTLDKFASFIVNATKNWVGDRMENRMVLRDLLSTFHEDHNDLTSSLSSIQRSKYTPWACDPGNDPRKIVQNYFELKILPPTVTLSPKNLFELFYKILELQNMWQKKFQLQLNRAVIPIRIVGKHTFNLIVSPPDYPLDTEILRSKNLFVFADTNWEKKGEDLFWAFSIDETGMPFNIAEITFAGEVSRILDESEWSNREWEFFLPLAKTQ
jgi:hypothetical protein